MPISKKQLRTMKEKRETILSQALILFRKDGYDETTIQKLPRRRM